MSTLLNKHKVCEIRLSNFGCEMVEGYNFWTRYDDFVKITKRYTPSIDFEATFATPMEGSAKDSLEWFIPNGRELGISLSRLKELDTRQYELAAAERRTLLETLQRAENGADEVAKERLKILSKSLSEEYSDNFCTLSNDGRLIVAMWGIYPREGRELSDVVRMDTVDHSVFTITFDVDPAKGITSFRTILRTRGYTICPSDIPSVTPKIGYNIIGWKPNPLGQNVDSNLIFTAQFEKSNENNPKDEESHEEGKEEEDFENNPPSPNPFNPEDSEDNLPPILINFIPTPGGELHGRTRIEKVEGSTIRAEEIPSPSPHIGYHFVGWDQQPLGHIVNSPFTFTAHFEEDDILYSVDFNHTEGGKLEGSTHYEKHDGERIPPIEVPTPVPNEGYRFVGWDMLPENYIVHSDVAFTAQFEKDASTHAAWWGKIWGAGCLGRLLRWLLLGLLLLLILLLLWCFLFGTCWRGNCGCDDLSRADSTRYEPTPTPTPTPNPSDTTQNEPNPCSTTTVAKEDVPYIGQYDMGQEGGEFLFSYYTANAQADTFWIYDGKGTSGRLLWSWGGLTGSESFQQTIQFHERFITVQVNTAIQEGTVWEFTVNCPR